MYTCRFDLFKLCSNSNKTQTCTNVSVMYTVQLKQSSGLKKCINVLERNFYAAGQKFSEKSNHLHNISDTQTTLMSECSLKV